MCSHYHATQDRQRLATCFGVTPPQDMGKHDVWPGYASTFIRKADQHRSNGNPAIEREALTGLFGLVPHWATDLLGGRKTYNARTETVDTKPTFRDAWSHAQHCIIPVDSFFEPDWRSGRAVPARISAANNEPMGIAGLWSAWNSPKGVIYSFTMLTINADSHPLMCQFHKPVDEKRMVVILPPERYDAWLHAKANESMEFMQAYPSELLKAESEAPVQRSLLD
jgi:putative SOS response-associated peptidase YedK